MTTNSLTTLAGGGAGIAMITEADWPGIMSGHFQSFGRVVCGVLLIVLGFFTNRIGEAGSYAGTVPSGTPLSPEAPNIAGTPVEPKK